MASSNITKIATQIQKSSKDDIQATSIIQELLAVANASAIDTLLTEPIQLLTLLKNKNVTQERAIEFFHVIYDALLKVPDYALHVNETVLNILSNPEVAIKPVYNAPERKKPGPKPGSKKKTSAVQNTDTAKQSTLDDSASVASTSINYEEAILNLNSQLEYLQACFEEQVNKNKNIEKLLKIIMQFMPAEAAKAYLNSMDNLI